MNINLIGISGKSKSGKDLVVKIIQCLKSNDKDFLDFFNEDPQSALSIYEDNNKNWSGCYNNLGYWKNKKFTEKVTTSSIIITSVSSEIGYLFLISLPKIQTVFLSPACCFAKVVLPVA